MRSEEIKKLKRQRELLLEQTEETEFQLASVGREYEDFFRKASKWKGFKLYKRLPNVENLKAYLEFYDVKDRFGYDDPHHPLDDERRRSYSYFNLEELAVLLKILYQL